jgi:hypothetical protein
VKTFKAGDLVKIKSKSTGRRLEADRYDPDKPQKISRVDGRIIVIHGDYYLYHDVEHWYSDIENLFDKLIEEL